MPLSPLFTEPEGVSIFFFVVNLLGAVLVRILFRSWPFSPFWSSIYAILVYVITRRLAAGRVYIPTKNLRGQTVVVTGAASGIGRMTALQLAKLGARVIIGVRGQQRAIEIAKVLSKESNNGIIIGHDLDLSNLSNVRMFANKIDQADILINNAGVALASYSETVDGIEEVFGTNHIGHFYLTKLLLPLLKHGRVINVSSLAHHSVPPTGIDYSFARLKKKYATLQAYSISKIAQIWHASELTRRYGIKAYSLHPGTIFSTNLHQHTHRFQQILFAVLARMSGKTIEQGAMTILYCALSDAAQPSHFHSDCVVAQPSLFALDKHQAEACWNESENLIDAKIQS